MFYPKCRAAAVCAAVFLAAVTAGAVSAQDMPPAADTAAELPAAPAVQQAPVAAQNAPAGPARPRWNLNLNYPGAGLRYFTAEGRAWELLGQGEDKIFTGGLRYYRYPRGSASWKFRPFLAIEADYINFNGKYSDGSGWGGGVYAGAEYFLGKDFSVQTDLGAMYVSVEDKDTDLMESGLEFLINLGFNVYFGGGLE